MRSDFDQPKVDATTVVPFKVSPLLLGSITEVEGSLAEKLGGMPKELLLPDGNFEADILFLGSGPAGYVGAIRAGRMGARTVVIEKSLVGGTCLNVGCIPTKALLSTVEILNTVARADEFGINVDGYSIDFTKMMKRKDKIVEQLRGGIELLFKKEKVRLVRGIGRILDKHTVEVIGEDGKPDKITARNIIIATGSVPALLPLPGFEPGGAIWTSNEAVSATAVPKSLLIIGGGYVGLEFGYTYAKLGSSVTIVEMLPRIAGNSDAEIAGELRKQLKKAGINILTDTSVLKADDIPGGKRVTIRTPEGKEEQIEAEKVLVAVGRKALTDGIGLEAIGVHTENGKIVVNDRMQTNVPGVYAIGDCIGDPMLAHVAFHESLIAVANCLGQDAHVDYKAVPGVIFTHPEVASVGLTEEKAREQYGDGIRVGKFPFAANGKALGIGEKDGFAKVITEPRYGAVLGVHIIGPHATDMIAEAVLAIQSEATIDDIEAAIHPHPTLSEPIHEAALDTEGKALHKS